MKIRTRQGAGFPGADQALPLRAGINLGQRPGSVGIMEKGQAPKEFHSSVDLKISTLRIFGSS
jgi:hypothetical protein